MNSFLIVIGGIPLLIYLLILSAFYCRRSPKLLTGPEDRLLLAFALSGFILAGPLLYIVPIDVLLVWGGVTWLLLMLLYILVIFFIGSLLRPRFMLYNMEEGEARTLMKSRAQEKGIEIEESGPFISFPVWNEYLYLEKGLFFRNVSITSMKKNSSPSDRFQMEQFLIEAFEKASWPKRRGKDIIRLAVLVLLLAIFLCYIGWTDRAELFRTLELFFLNVK